MMIFCSIREMNKMKKTRNEKRRTPKMANSEFPPFPLLLIIIPKISAITKRNKAKISSIMTKNVIFFDGDS